MWLACGGEPPERLVLITIDTLRFDAFPASMPATTELARGCAVFEHFFAASSSTQPTHATLFTGLHPWQHGVARNGRVLGEEHQTLAERLRAAGFGTHAVVASFPLASRFGFAQGFDDYRDDFEEVLAIWQDVGGGPPGDRFYTLANGISDAAIAALDRWPSGRQFFWFHYFDPHAPYGDTTASEPLTPRPLVGRVVAGELGREEGVARARALYMQDVEALDSALGRLLERLGADAARIPTHVLLTADHGESLGEGGILGHGSSVSAEQVRVPTLLCSPAVAPGPRSDVAGSIDVANTLLELAGAPALAGGRSLATDDPSATAFGMRRTYDGVHEELRLDGGTERIEGLEFFAVDERGRLQRGAPDTEPRFAGFADQLGPEPAPGVDPEVEEGLRALGYVP